MYSKLLLALLLALKVINALGFPIVTCVGYEDRQEKYVMQSRVYSRWKEYSGRIGKEHGNLAELAAKWGKIDPHRILNSSGSNSFRIH